MPEDTHTPEAGQTLSEADASHASRRNTTRSSRRPNTNFTSTSRDFEGVTPKIGGVLALRSENMLKKVNYDIFCEKLGVYMMNEFKGGENVVEVTKKPNDRYCFFFSVEQQA